jgi:hypothetical protein
MCGNPLCIQVWYKHIKVYVVMPTRSATLGLTQPLTWISTRTLPGRKGWPESKAYSSPLSVSRLSRKCGIGNLDVSQLYWPPRHITGTDFFSMMSLLRLYNLRRFRSLLWCCGYNFWAMSPHKLYCQLFGCFYCLHLQGEAPTHSINIGRKEHFDSHFSLKLI